MTLTFDISKLTTVKNSLYHNYHIIKQAIKKSDALQVQIEKITVSFSPLQLNQV